MNELLSSSGPRIPWSKVLTLTVALVLAQSAPWAAAEEHEVEPNQEGPPRAVSTKPVEIRRNTTNIGPSPVVFSSFAGYYDGGSEVRPYPPDPHGAVGPAGIMQVVNEHITYYRKDGSVATYPPTTALTMEFGQFLPGGEQIVDPQIQYDPGTGRFFLTGISARRLDCSSDCYVNLRLAVSKSSDPATLTSNDWYFYTVSASQIDNGVNYGVDYPQSGFDATTFYVTGNMFPLPFGASSFSVKVRIFAFDKSQLAAGTLAYNTIDAPSDAFALQPAVVLGGTPPSGVAYFSEVYGGSTTQVRLWALSNALGTPSLTSTFVTVPNHGGGISNAPQCGGTGINLSTLDSRAHGNSFWLNGELWLCHNGGASMGRSIVFYYDLNTNGFPNGTPTLTEAGGMDGGSGVWNYCPAIGATPQGDVGMVFTQSSASQCPTVMATARRAGDTGFPTPVSVAISSSYYNGIGKLDTLGGQSNARWGDYAIVSPDPVDGTLWVSHEISNGTGAQDLWATVWGDLQIPPSTDGWTTDGVTVRSSLTTVRGPRVVPDGSGGAYIAWADKRSALGSGWTMYVQRITSTGGIASGWEFGGIAVGSLKDETVGNFAVTPDGAGGLYAAWTDISAARVQRLTAAGGVAASWPSAGLTLASTSVQQVQAVGDGSGGVLVAWAASGAIRVHRINSSASAVWTSGPVQVGSSGNNPRLIADGSGGAIVAWTPNVRMQRVAGDGTIQWTSGGVTFATGGSSVGLAADGAGGAYVAFQLPEAGTGAQDAYVLRVTGGSVASGWATGGTRITPTGFHPQGLQLAADGAGGALCAWADDRNSATTGFDIFAIRLTSAGAAATGWAATGVAVCSAAGDQTAPSMVAAEAGGAVMSWADARGSTADIFAQAMTGNGVRTGSIPANGVALCSAPGSQGFPSTAFTGTGACITAWEDARSNLDCDLSTTCAFAIDAQRQTFDIVPPAAVTDLTAAFGRTSATVSWTEPGDDGNTGMATAFDLRYSNSPITTQADFAGASTLSAPPPQGPGTPQCVTLSAVSSCTPFYFALETADEAGNAASLSNVSHGSTRCTGQTEVQCQNGLVAEKVPNVLELAVESPTPSNQLRVRYGVPPASTDLALECALFDVSGRKLALLASGSAAPGYHELQLDPARVAGGLRAGHYYVRLVVGREKVTTRLVFVP